MPSRNKSPSSWLLATVAGFLTLAAATTFYLELSPFLASGPTVPDKITAIVAGGLNPGPSYRSKFLVLNDCQKALEYLPVDKSGDDSQAVLRHCAEIANGVAKDSPSYSYAWVIVALATSGLKDFPAMNEALDKSQITAPTQAWLVRARSFVAEENYAALTPEQRELHDRDLKVLLETYSNLPWVAARYLADVSAQTRISDVVGSMSPEVQARFVGSVRRQSQTSQASP